MNNTLSGYAKHWQGCPSVGEVARAYFPNYARTDRAVRQFRLKIQNSPILLKELLEAEYNPKDKFLTPAQVELIVRHWKLPENIVHLANDHEKLSC